MSGLSDYLQAKGIGLRARRETRETAPEDARTLTARITAEGRSGVRRIRIRDHQILTDSGSDLAGYDLGATSVELQLGALGSCLTHVLLIQAADRGFPLDAIDVEVSARMDPRAGQSGFSHGPFFPHDISYTAHVTSLASAEVIASLYEAVEETCPILRLIVTPQRILGHLVHTPSGSTAVAPVDTSS